MMHKGAFFRSVKGWLDRKYVSNLIYRWTGQTKPIVHKGSRRKKLLFLMEVPLRKLLNFVFRRRRSSDYHQARGGWVKALMALQFKNDFFFSSLKKTYLSSFSWGIINVHNGFQNMRFLL